MEILKIPVQLVKRLADGSADNQYWKIEVPEEYRMTGVQMEPWKGYFFVVVGPFEEQSEIEQFISKEAEDGDLQDL